MDANDRVDFFARVYHKNLWGSVESRSGQGSELARTKHLRECLPILFNHLKIARFLDLPCGDFHWMQHVDLTGVDYIGADIVPDIVAANQARYGNPSRRFMLLDIVQDLLPAVEMLFTRDCLIHFSNDLALQAQRNIARSNIQYFCTSALDTRIYNPATPNVDLERTQHGVNFEYRPINFLMPPYCLPEPIYALDDFVDGQTSWKSIMGVWKVEEIRKALL